MTPGHGQIQYDRRLIFGGCNICDELTEVHKNLQLWKLLIKTSSKLIIDDIGCSIKLGDRKKSISSSYYNQAAVKMRIGAGASSGGEDGGQNSITHRRAVVMRRKRDDFRLHDKPHGEVGSDVAEERPDGHAHLHELLLFPRTEDSAQELLRDQGGGRGRTGDRKYVCFPLFRLIQLIMSNVVGRDRIRLGKR